MTEFLSVLAAAAFAFLLAVPMTKPRGRVVIVRPPTTWQAFLRSPFPWVARDVPLRDGGPVATVYNRAAALRRMALR